VDITSIEVTTEAEMTL